MISYRSLKKLIGESSLERKCRFLFGFALLFLITASFWLYAYRTQKLVENQQVFAARMLLPRLLEIRHQQRFIQLANAEKQTAEVKDREANATRVAEATNSPDAEPAAPLSTEARPDLPELELLIKVLDQSSSLAERCV